MAGLYVHIPFCRNICAYCDFYTTAAVGPRNELFEALLREMEIRRDYIKELDTIYIGGGTPSLLSPDKIETLIEHACKIWRPNKLAEVTIEVNPEDITDDYAGALVNETRVSRVSIGVQSFNDDILRAMRRGHDGKTAAEAIKRLHKAGILNISADFIYGIPGQSTSTIRADLKKALALDVQHLSAYHLSIEDRSILSNRMKRGLFTPVDDKTSDTHFQAVRDVMNKAGFLHYEISNFASNEWYCGVHNSNYWLGVPYLGLGPGAHSFDGTARHANISSLPLYLRYVDSGRHFTTETPRRRHAQRIRNVIVTHRMGVRHGTDAPPFRQRPSGRHTQEGRAANKERTHDVRGVAVTDQSPIFSHIGHHNIFTVLLT